VPMATNQSVGLICLLTMCCNSSTKCLITLAQYIDNVLARGRQPTSTAPNESRCIEMLAQRAGAGGHRWQPVKPQRHVGCTLAQDMSSKCWFEGDSPITQHQTKHS
jgi:hypothetical protein